MKKIKMCVCLIVMIFMSISLMAKDTKITKDTKDTKITITGDSITIKQAFEQIEAQSKFTIAYNQTKFDTKRKFRVSIKNASIESALTSILKNTGFTYKKNGFHIVIQSKNKAPQSSREGDVKKLTQTIRGTVRDAASEESLPGATVVLLNTDPLQGSASDSLGRFRFDNVPIGRYDMQVSMIGYEPTIIKEVLVSSAKESYNEVVLKEQLTQLDEVVVRPQVDKEQPLNVMALAGGRMFSVEEANRFAGGFDDPARLVSSFAGVAGGSATTGLSVHGNSPQFLQWRLEGVEIPNPTHFADMAGVGGGTFTALSSQVMGNSDFFNGAFPAEYSNALSAVFDMSMRSGNNQKHEHTFQASILGIDFASEGPLNKKSGSSYIVNYRYMNTEPIKSMMGDLAMEFQDLSFKFNFPTRKAGTFSIWGLGLIDDFTSPAVVEESEWLTARDMQQQALSGKKMATGANHKIFVGKGAYIKSSLAATYSEERQQNKMIENKEPFKMFTIRDMSNDNWNISFNSYFNKKFSARHTNRTGVTVTGLFYDMDYNISPTDIADAITSNIAPMEQIADGGNSSAMFSAFSNSLINITDRLSTNIGITSQFFALNNSWSLEPRVSFEYKVAPSHTLAVAYGLHSRREKLDYYYIKTPETGDELVNKDLSFTKANHFVLSYSWGISDNIHLRVEPYYQHLFDVPVEPGTSFSTINHVLFYLDKALVNKGKGRNYGLDITLERYIDKGYYWLLTGSVFSSKYKGGDGVWRNTRYNRKFITNALIGKDWVCGKQKQNVFSANIGLLYQGGEYDTPIDLEASEEQQKTVHDHIQAFSIQYPSTLTIDFTIGYRINKKKVSHEFSVKVLSVTGTPEQDGYTYNLETKQAERTETPVTLPNVSYKLYF